MNRFAIAAVVALGAAFPAVAQDVTRAEPAARYVSPSDLALLPAETVTVTVGAATEVAAADLFEARERALKDLAADDRVAVTVFEGGNSSVSPR